MLYRRGTQGLLINGNTLMQGKSDNKELNTASKYKTWG